MYWFCMTLAVGGFVLYNISIRKIGGAGNAFVTMLWAYGVASILCALSVYAVPAVGLKGPGLTPSIRFTPWTFGIGISVFLIECGYAFALGYHQEHMSRFTPGVYGCVIVGVTLVGAIGFSESLSPVKLAGIALCVVGVFLVGLSR